MTRYALIAALLACLGLGAAAWRLSLKADRLADDNAALRLRDDQARDITGILGAALVRERVSAAISRADFEDLANVMDDNTCRSPAVDRAFDILRRRAADRAAGGSP